MKEAAGTVLVVLITGSLLGLSSGSPAPETSGDSASGDSLEAQIDLRREGEQLQVCGIYLNRRGQSMDNLSYRLTVERSGSGGSATSRQSGPVQTAPKQIDTLSTVVVNVTPGARVDVRLQILQGEHVVKEAQRVWTVEGG